MSSLKDFFSKKLTPAEILIIIIFIIGATWIIWNWLSAKQIAEYEEITKSDLRRLVFAEERYFTNNNKFISCSGIADCESKLRPFKVSRNSKRKPELYNIGVIVEDGNVRGVFTKDGLFTAIARHEDNSIAYKYDRRYRSFFKTK